MAAPLGYRVLLWKRETGFNSRPARGRISGHRPVDRQVRTGDRSTAACSSLFSSYSSWQRDDEMKRRRPRGMLVLGDAGVGGRVGRQQRPFTPACILASMLNDTRYYCNTALYYCGNNYLYAVPYTVVFFPVSEMTYTVSSGTLNPSIPHHPRQMLLSRRKKNSFMLLCHLATDNFFT